MKLISKVCAGVALGASGLVGVGVQAAPTFGDGFNGIFFQNYETLFRASTACTPAQPCEAAVAGDPAGYLRVDRSVAGNVKLGDKFIGILNIQNIDSPAQGNTVWSQTIGSDRFTGYFVQEVTAIGGVGPTNAVITLGAGADPFGKLAAGQMFALYTGTTFSTVGTLANSIASATSGSLWAKLGLGSEGYAYTLTDLTATITDSDTEAFLGLDKLADGPAYNAGPIDKMNDFNESLRGGVASAGAAEICNAADLANALVSCTDFAGTSEIEDNTNYAAGTTSSSVNWQYQSNDPFKFYRAVPEPGSLALVGFALLGLGIARRRLKA